MSRVASIALVVLAAAILNAGPVGISASVHAAESDLNEARQFRQTFGFPADDATLIASHEDRSRYSNSDYGVALTQDEADELMRRAAVQHAKAPVAAYLQESVASFAGTYTDQLNGGVPVFLFADEPEAYRTEIQSLLPVGTEFRVERTIRSLAALDDLQATIDGSWNVLRDAGIKINMTAIDVKKNVVVVGIQDLAPSHQANLEGRFGPGVAVEESSPAEGDACVSDNDCRPIKGGLKIVATNGGFCTSGYVVRRSEGGWAVLTAGHCIDYNGTTGTNWHHDGDKFGDALYETWREGNTADVGLIDIDDNEVVGDRNETYVQSAAGSPNIRHIVGWDPATSQGPGDQACRFGVATRWLCGSITKEDATRESCVNNNQICYTIYHTTETDLDAQGGDSGAAFIYPITGTSRIGLGTHVHSSDGYDTSAGKGWFSPIDWGKWTYQADFHLNYTICITSSC